jgi:hypothetical protein
MKAVWPRIEPLALIAATLATGMAICYVWLIRQHRDGSIVTRPDSGTRVRRALLRCAIPGQRCGTIRMSPGQMESARSSKAMRS